VTAERLGWGVRLLALRAAIQQLVTGRHTYISTACQHGDHDYCKGVERQDGGSKTPARCKFCPASCQCYTCDHDGLPAL
jgi:hypothetical protein